MGKITSLDIRSAFFSLEHTQNKWNKLKIDMVSWNGMESMLVGLLLCEHNHNLFTNRVFRSKDARIKMALFVFCACACVLSLKLLNWKGNSPESHKYLVDKRRVAFFALWPCVFCSPHSLFPSRSLSILFCWRKLHTRRRQQWHKRWLFHAYPKNAHWFQYEWGILSIFGYQTRKSPRSLTPKSLLAYPKSYISTFCELLSGKM